jgi:PhnB protein
MEVRTMPVKPIPDGYSTVTPYLIIKDAARALDYYKQALGAVEVFRMQVPGGRVMHAEIQVGDSRIMMADEFPEMCAQSPQTYGGTPVSLCLYVENADALFDQAVAAGATVRRAVQDQFYGDRSGTLVDPFGHVWTIATHKEDLTPEEIGNRAKAFMKPSAA